MYEYDKIQTVLVLQNPEQKQLRWVQLTPAKILYTTQFRASDLYKSSSDRVLTTSFKEPVWHFGKYVYLLSF